MVSQGVEKMALTKKDKKFVKSYISNIFKPNVGMMAMAMEKLTAGYKAPNFAVIVATELVQEARRREIKTLELTKDTEKNREISDYIVKQIRSMSGNELKEFVSSKEIDRLRIEQSLVAKALASQGKDKVMN